MPLFPNVDTHVDRIWAAHHQICQPAGNPSHERYRTLSPMNAGRAALPLRTSTDVYGRITARLRRYPDGVSKGTSLYCRRKEYTSLDEAHQGHSMGWGGHLPPRRGHRQRRVLPTKEVAVRLFESGTAAR
jgi:hypothetical protein